MTHTFKPGDVAWWEGERIFREGYNNGKPGERWVSATNGECWPNPYDNPPHPLAVIDPESDADVNRFCEAFDHPVSRVSIRAALREFAKPTPPKPEEPTDPKTRVTDPRDNIWRLLADGDWVCTSGPDVGEYLVWWQLAERGAEVLSEGVTE